MNMNPRDFEIIHMVEYARIVRRFSRNKSHIQARWDARRLRRSLRQNIEDSTENIRKM